MREIISLNQDFGQKQKNKKKKVKNPGLNLRSPYPLRSAERSVFGQKKRSLRSTFFGPKKTQVDLKLCPLDGLNLRSP